MAGYDYKFEDLVPGTILECSWGYSMTIVDFYRVVGRYGKAHVTLEKLGNKIVEGSGWYGKCVPDTNVVRDRITNAFYSGKYGVIKLSKCQWLRLWDGKPSDFNLLD